MPLKKIVSFFTSLRLTVVLLMFAIVLVFVGTVAQVDEGLYNAQARYFRQWLIFGIDLFGRKIPLILPGGYLIGTLLLLNLLAAHIYRFQLSAKKIGIQLAHAGVILLLVGQLVTDMLARETQIQFTEGETKSYAESATECELAFVAGDEVTAIPQHLLVAGDRLKIDNLPFTVQVKSFWKNSDTSFRAPMMQNSPALTTNGVGNAFDFHRSPDIKTMDERNIPTAVIALAGSNGSLGDWVVSEWTSDERLIATVQTSYTQQLGADMAGKITATLVQPQSVVVNGKKYTFMLRPARHYEPFSLTLLKATHTIYPGTDIPKDFRSRVRLENPKTGENREVEISMNHPLRYAGLTFYQYQMDAGTVAREAGHVPSSVLQVVHNPAWLTPYLGCALVAAGLIIQFLYHLISFVSKRKTK